MTRASPSKPFPYLPMRLNGGYSMIRPLSVEELPSLMPLAVKAYREIYEGEMDPKEFLSSWIPLIQGKYGEILVSYQEEVIEGFLGYVYQDNMFTGALEVSVQFVYILPSSRGNGILDQFLEHLEGLQVSRVELTMRGPFDYRYLGKKGYEPLTVVYGKDLS